MISIVNRINFVKELIMKYRSIRKSSLKDGDGKRSRNKTAQRKRRLKVKDLKTENPDEHAALLRKRNRHQSKYRIKLRTKSGKRKLTRYRKLLARNTKFIRGMFLQQKEEVVEEYFDLDDLIKSWRNTSEIDDMDDCKSVDEIVELVSLQIENDFHHPKRQMEEVTIVFKKQPTKVLIPTCMEAAWDASDNTLLWDKTNKKLYYWQYGKLTTDEELSVELVYTKRCSPAQYKQIDLEHFLEDYDLNIEDLMGS